MNTDDKFQEIYEKYKNLIFKIAFDKTRDFHLAQDICQETFLKLYGYQDYVDETRIKYWLIVVAKNMIRDYFRKGGKYTVVPSSMEDMHKTLEEENCIDAYLDHLGLLQFEHCMMSCLAEKNSEWCDVFLKAEYLKIPRKLIAKEKNIALSTVDSYLKKSKKWLKDHYYDEYKSL